MPILVALLALMGVLGVVDRSDRDSLTPIGARVATAFAPAAAPPDSLTSSWYCPANTAVAGGVADSTVVIFNPTDRKLSGAVEIIGGDGTTRASVDVDLAPRTRAAVPLTVHMQNPYVTAVVRLNGGGAIVEHQTTGPVGTASGACASSASTHWYVPEGTTTKSATLIYALFNPFPDDAIVDLSFSTESGRESPAALQGVVVPANSLVPLDIGSHVRRRAHISGALAVRRGRIVVESLQVHNGDGRRGVGLTLGAPRTATSFVFPDGIAGAERSEQLHLFNPNGVEAAVSLDLVLDSGEAEPFALRVPAHDRITVDLAAESRIPKDVGHALMLRVSNNVPVAVSRTIDVGPPTSRRGFISDIGATTAAWHWGFSAGGSAPTQEEYIAIVNEASHAVTVSITTAAGSALDPLKGAARITIPRGARKAFRLADLGGTAETPLIVNASGAVVVSRTVIRVGGVGASTSSGVILSTNHG